MRSPFPIDAQIYQQGAEPGYYIDGEYDIRIENVVVLRETRTTNNFGGKGFLAFEYVTMVSFFSHSPVFGHCNNMAWEGAYWAQPC